MRRPLAMALAVALGAAVVWSLVPGEPEPVGGAVRVLRAGAEVELSGPLSLEMAASLRRAGSPGVVQLDSPGGSRAGAEAVASAIRDAGLQTAVTDRCLSVCVAAFMAGRRRWVGPFAQVGLEAASVPLYRRAGVPEAAVREAAAAPQGQAWFPTAAEMMQAGLATDAAAPDRFALGGFGPAPTPAGIRERLLTVPLYRAVAAADPAGFEATLALWVATVLDGRPSTAAFDDLRALLAHAFATALPLAPDPLLLAHAALFRDELAWMMQHDPAGCAGWAAAQGGLPGPTDEDLVSRRREIALAVLTAAPPPGTAPAMRRSECALLAERWRAPLPVDRVRSLLRPS